MRTCVLCRSMRVNVFANCFNLLVLHVGLFIYFYSYLQVCMCGAGSGGACMQVHE